ncbi:MAG: alpha amylase C-terminal domain-containing protein [Armatimonadetes bacterium]|nr:alpha amylase C-terminal domain-containing protein [Armatimonadota bacterium]
MRGAIRPLFWGLTAAPFLAFAQEQGSGTDYFQYLPPGQFRTFSIHPSDWQGKLTVTLQNRLGDANIYLRRNSAPTLDLYDHRSTSLAREETFSITNSSAPPLTSDTWYIGFYSEKGCFIKETHTAQTIPAEFPGKGATPWVNGTTFRVFAPFAQEARAAGQFNSWNNAVSNMGNQGGGWWSVDYRNARPGQQYKFVVKANNQLVWKNDPWARQLTNSVGNSVIFDQGAYQWQTNNFVTPPWSEMVVYEMHVGAFNPTVSGKPGTFASAELKLDYLQGLGVNVIELMPVNEFPGDYSWGYNPSYPYSVESAYGGPTALKHFIDQANARGIAVLLDVVHNHYGPNDMDIWRFDGWYQGQWGGVFFYNDQRGNTPWGWTRPDYGRTEVRDYIRDNQAMWAGNYRMSGFRWDSTQYMRTTDLGDNPDGWSLMQALNNDQDATQPWKINIGEDLQNNDWITRPTSQGGAGYDSQWSNFVHTVRSTMTTPDDNARDMNAVAGYLNERFNGDAFHRVIYTESHDEDANGHQRLPNEIDVNNPASYWAQKRSTLAAALALTAPGIPMLFQGQEFLESGWFDANRPLDWSKTTTFAGIKQLYTDLIKLRRNTSGKSRGLTGQGMNLFHNNNTNKVIAYHRYSQGGSGDDVVCVFNFRNTTYNNYRIGLPRGGGWSVAFNSDWNGYSGLFGNLFSPNFTADSTAYDGMPNSGTVNLAPYTCVILAKD